MRIFENGDITFRCELIDEIEQILDGSALRAVGLVESLNWDEIVAPTYMELKKLIVENPLRRASQVDEIFENDLATVLKVFGK